MRLGWRVHDGDGQVDRVCGNGIEALEVPRPAGVVAVHWWLHTGGAPDEIRRLPALPGPQDALAVIAAGDRYLFLVQSGACPWAGPDLAVAPPAGGPPGVAVRWHADGSRIPAPPCAARAPLAKISERVDRLDRRHLEARLTCGRRLPARATRDEHGHHARREDDEPAHVSSR